ncbi:MAG: methyltransferase domain-containing protein [Desulfobacteraceae bacterium]|nr:methyltransferase domain-containing protein [Desulfobacteraceae bacterium]
MGITQYNHLIIDCFNIKEFNSNFENISCFVGDATDLKNVRDKEYDIAFSNSVIEHVGSFAEQKKMASEVRRVAKNYFVQTPNFWFPIEPHARLPFAQFLPLFLKTLLMLLILRKSIHNFGMVRSAVDNVRLLTRTKLEILFPDGIIIEERFCGIVKSFMIHNI